MDKDTKKTMNAVTVGIAAAGTIAAGVALGPVAAVPILVGTMTGGLGVTGAVDASEKSAIRKKYEGTTRRAVGKKEVPKQIRIDANERKQKRK